MDFIVSIILFLIVFIPTSLILNKMLIIFHKKFPLFEQLHCIIRNSRKEKLMSNIGWIITVISFYIVASFFNFNDYQAGFVCAIINSFILTIVEPEKIS